jgi:hypothetical protein
MAQTSDENDRIVHSTNTGCGGSSGLIRVAVIAAAPGQGCRLWLEKNRQTSALVLKSILIGFLRF